MRGSFPRARRCADVYKRQVLCRRSGQPGRFSFSRRAHLLTTCESRRWQPSRWSGSCALHEVPFSRFSRGGRQCRKRTLPVQLAAMFCLNIKTVVKQPANCLRKPATGSLVADMGIASPATPIFFLRKRNKNEGKVRTNGNLDVYKRQLLALYHSSVKSKLNLRNFIL